MKDQLFRFSVLRAAEAAEGLTPIVVIPIDSPGNDRLVPVAQAIAAALKKQPDLSAINAGELLTDLALDPTRWRAEDISGLVTFEASALTRQRVVV